MDKMKATLLAVPYTHLVTTMPHTLNRLARENPKQIYNLLFRATRKTVWKITGDSDHLGATPGMVSVLHTFGSDLKHHVHVHSLVTFGGMDNDGEWQYPKHKKRYCRNSKLRHTFKTVFLAELKKLFAKGLVTYHQSYEVLAVELEAKRWTVFVTHPSMNTATIEKYLARYINRVGVSNSRVQYVKDLKQVHLRYNDYRQQQEGQVAPKEVNVMEPLSFIHQVLQHLPPPYFQLGRRYGLHANAKSGATKKLIEQKARNHGRAIRTVCEIVTHLMKLQPWQCQNCGAAEHTSHDLKPDASWIFNFITLPTIRSPVY